MLKLIKRNKSSILVCLLPVAILIGFYTICFSQDFNYQKAYQLYQQVVRGEKKLENLTSEERRQVMIIHRALSSSSDDEGSEDCREAKESARSAADELAYYAKKLKSCAENYDFSDDCYTEYRRTKNAFDDYESAVSDVSSECD